MIFLAILLGFIVVVMALVRVTDLLETTAETRAGRDVKIQTRIAELKEETIRAQLAASADRARSEIPAPATRPPLRGV